MDPQILSVGKLRIKGAEIRYERPPTLSYKVDPGRPILFQLHYAYEEDSPERENCIVRFRVNPDGERGRLNETNIVDTPVLKDQVQGILEQPYRGVAANESASFEIDAFYERRRWFGMRRTRNAIFNHQERFDLVAHAAPTPAPRPAPKPASGAKAQKTAAARRK